MDYEYKELLHTYFLERIEDLNASKKAKEVLIKTLTVVESDNCKIKESAKSLFIKSPSSEVSEFGKLYEGIIKGNEVYKVTGKTTYIELAFPNTSNENDYNKFFRSPRVAAMTLNEYVGVWLISFEQFAGYGELEFNSEFSRLIKYIDEHKDIFYVFHVLPDFCNSEDLRKRLNGHVNLLTVELSSSKARDVIERVIRSLDELNIKLSDGAKRKLSKYINDYVDVNSKAYEGENTINRLLNDILFEVTALRLEDDSGTIILDDKTIDKILRRIDFTLDDGRDKNHRFGFT